MGTARHKLTNAGLEFIAAHEGFIAHPYNDAAGHATVAYGHLLHKGPVTPAEVQQGRQHPLTRVQGLALLHKDVHRFEEAVNAVVKVPLTPSQFDALVSFAFNVGDGAFASSTLLKKLNSEHREQAADEFLIWNKAGGRVVAGLTVRRKAERRMFLTGIRKTPAPEAKVGKFFKGPSAHFTWQEVHRGRKPFGPRERANAIVHARRLEQLRAEINNRRARRKLKPTSINILSWFRPRAYNVAIGGAKNSQHIYGLATDISLQEIDRLMPWGGGRAEFDSVCNHVYAAQGFGQYPGGSRHVDSRGFKARWSSWGT